MDRYFDMLDERWQALPVRKQHQYTLYFFVGYLLLTVAVIGKVLSSKKLKALQDCRTHYQQF